ncbi:DUF1003 domain-containing protein [Pedosphaera parvula]|uniref:DUF1003 domain-containing protein n=1 Tax=Pedosphaera parvula (strain Ellin514) TaxID=320771 RepID=B9XEX9_PEDPL|nr:DUF1003 domain-containing protein [Pedosphaera parvula]EEF61477.1 protein of unknown function DUF1003 [Pedosphaera parvula Ellin514]
MSRKKSISQITRKNVETILKMEQAADESRTFGERVADGFAACVGSWTFIIIQSVLLAIWVCLNLIAWVKHWDPYPFILLNLALSFQAAYASPIIMMSQNRLGRLSERRNRLDLQINLLAEQENTEMLRLLHKICEKLEIPLKDQPTAECLEQVTRPESLLRQIEKTESQNGKSKK